MSQPHAARRPKLKIAALAGATVVAAAFLAGCGGTDPSGGGSDSSGGSGTRFVEGTGEITRVPAGKRRAAPAILGKTLQGKPLSLADYRGKVVVLNVWGSWCSPCRAEARHLAKVSRDTEEDGVRFIGINTRDLDPANAEAFERTYKIGYPSLYDPTGRLVLKFRNSLPPQAIPSTLVLDREGGVAVRALKPLAEEELRKALAPVVAESRGGAESPGRDTDSGTDPGTP